MAALGPDFQPSAMYHHRIRPVSPEISRTYRGHRRASFVSPDVDELVELRARQRTFDGAYIRTALGNFGYALLILKVFTKEFARIGLLYVILAILLLLISYKRARRSDHDFADVYRHDYSPPIQSTERREPLSAPDAAALASSFPPTDSTKAVVGSAGPRIWGRPFRTSGDVVVLICFVCCGLYAAIFALVMEL